MKPARDFDDLNCFVDPSRWPMWPYLPLKNHLEKDDGLAKIGVLLANKGPVVYLTNLFEAKYETCEKVAFTNFRAILEAGWLVD